MPASRRRLPPFLLPLFVALAPVACDRGGPEPVPTAAKHRAPPSTVTTAKFDPTALEPDQLRPKGGTGERDAGARPATDEDAKMAKPVRDPVADFVASRDAKRVEVTARPGTPEWFVQGLEAFRAGDIDPIVANFAIDIEWDAVGSPLEPPSIGKPAVLSRWEDLLTAIPDMKLHARRIFHRGELVVMQVVLTGSHKGDFRGIAATGKPLGAEVLAWVWHDADGKAKRVRVVYDEAALLSQMGQLGAAAAAKIPEVPEGAPEIIGGDEDPAAAKAVRTMLSAGKKAWTLCETKYCAADMVSHDVRTGETMTTAEQHRQGHDAFFTAFPDAKVTVQDAVSFGPDWVVSFARVRGTHRGPLGAMPASNRKVEVAMSELLRLSAGKVAETWSYANGLQLLAAIGAFQAPAPNAAP